MKSSIAQAYVQIIPSADGIQGSLTNLFSGEAQSAGKTVGGSIGGSIMKTIAGIGIAKGIKDSITSVFDTGKEFDTAMSQVAATMGKSVDEITDLRDIAKEMGATTSFTASQAAEGLNYLALAGYGVNEQMMALPTVLDLAAAGAMDLGSASDMVTDAMSALGIEVSKDNLGNFVDTLAAMSSNSNTSVSQLGEALLTVGGTAKSLAGDPVTAMQEASKALGILADNGIKASEGGTHLRNIMLAMNPTTKKAKEAWSELGISAYDADGNLRPLQDVFADLNGAMEGFTDQEKTDILTKMFNKTDLSSVNALLATSADRWEELGVVIEESGGAAENMKKTQLDNVQGSLTLMGSALDGLKLSLWDTFQNTAKGAIDGFTNIVTAAQTFVDSHSEEIKGTINAIGDTFGLVVGGIQTAYNWTVTQINTDGTTFNSIFENGKTVIETLGSTFDTVAGSIASLFSWLSEQASTDGTVIHDTIDGIGTVIDKVKGIADFCFGEMIRFIKSLSETSDGESSTIQNAFGIVQSTIETVFTVVNKYLSIGKRFIDSLGISATDVKETISTAFDAVKLSIDNNMAIVKGVLDAVKNLVNGDFSGAWTSIQTTIDTVVGNIKGFFSGHEGLMSVWDSVMGKLDALKKKFEDIWGNIKKTVEDVLEVIKDPFAALDWHLPELKLPHVKIGTGTGPFGVQYPTFTVDWYAKAYNAPYLLDKATIFGGIGGGERGSYKGGELMYSHDELMKDIAYASGNDAVAQRLDEFISVFGQFMDRFENMSMVTETGKVVGAFGDGMVAYSKNQEKIAKW